MKMQLASVDSFKPVASMMSSTIPTITVVAEAGHITFMGMDESNTAFVEFKLLSSCFVEYDVPKREEFAINAERFKKIMGVLGPNDLLGFKKDRTKFVIEIQGHHKDVFNMATMDPKTNGSITAGSDVHIESPSERFEKGIKKARVIDDSLAFHIEDMIFSIQATDKLDDVKVNFEEDDEVAINSDIEGSVESRYSGEIIGKIIPVSKVFDKVMLSFAADMPLEMTYKLVEKMELRAIV